MMGMKLRPKEGSFLRSSCICSYVVAIWSAGGFSALPVCIFGSAICERGDSMYNRTVVVFIHWSILE